MKPFFHVVSPSEAREILGAIEPVGIETARTVHARGRVLAEDLYSKVDLPHFHRAAMDGYAVRAKDTFGASASQPAYLKVIETVEMGREATRPLGRGEAARIATGGMMPPESDAVLMIEYADEAGNGMVEIQRSVSPWQNVMRIGDDIGRGRIVFRRGRRLRAQDLGSLTGIGISSVAVFKKPRVALISTGDEIVEPDVEPAPGQVRNINQYSLLALLEECGAEVRDLGVVRDDKTALAKALEDGLCWGDLVLLSGGSSVGAKDIALEAMLSFARAKVLFHGISVSPGKPTIYVHAAGKPLLGLPGYPVSALVIFHLFAAPAIRILGGEDPATAWAFDKMSRAILKTNLVSQPGREDYVRVCLERLGGKVYATPLPGKSGAIFTLVHADGMVRIDSNQEGVEAGEEVEVILF